MKTYDELKAQQSALSAFWKNNPELKSVRKWAEASGVGHSTLNEAVRLKKIKEIEYDTYTKIASGASKILNKKISILDLGYIPNQLEITAGTSLVEEFIALIQMLPPDEAERELRGMKAKYPEIASLLQSSSDDKPE